MFKGKRDLIITSIKERMELQKDNHQGAFIANIRGLDIYIKGCDVIFTPIYIKTYDVTSEAELRINEATQITQATTRSFDNENEAIEYVADFIIENSFKI